MSRQISYLSRLLLSTWFKSHFSCWHTFSLCLWRYFSIWYLLFPFPVILPSSFEFKVFIYRITEKKIHQWQHLSHSSFFSVPLALCPAFPLSLPLSLCRRWWPRSALRGCLWAKGSGRRVSLAPSVCRPWQCRSGRSCLAGSSLSCSSSWASSRLTEQQVRTEMNLILSFTSSLSLSFPVFHKDVYCE